MTYDTRLEGENVLLRRENEELRKYLKAFCHASIHPDDHGEDAWLHDEYPFFNYQFSIVPDDQRSPRAITGGQIRRAMELIGFQTLKIAAPLLTISDELMAARSLQRQMDREPFQYEGTIDAEAETISVDRPITTTEMILIKDIVREYLTSVSQKSVTLTNRKNVIRSFLNDVGAASVTELIDRPLMADFRQFLDILSETFDYPQVRP